MTVADGVVIHAFSHLEGARVEPAPRSAPMRGCGPGAEIEGKARVGNFVEIKAARIEAGAKVNHLSYIGDARVGAGANIGAGTITCNYDGFDKAKTDIGAGAFIGSNSALVAPVKIGDGAIVGAGSVRDEGCRRRRAGDRARPASREAGLGEGVPRRAERRADEPARSSDSAAAGSADRRPDDGRRAGISRRRSRRRALRIGLPCAGSRRAWPRGASGVAHLPPAGARISTRITSTAARCWSPRAPIDGRATRCISAWRWYSAATRFIWPADRRGP